MEQDRIAGNSEESGSRRLVRVKVASAVGQVASGGDLVDREQRAIGRRFVLDGDQIPVIVAPGQGTRAVLQIAGPMRHRNTCKAIDSGWGWARAIDDVGID